MKKMYAEDRLKAEIAREAIEKKVVTPSRRKEMAQRAVQQFGGFCRNSSPVVAMAP